MSRVGMHLRITGSLRDVLAKAQLLCLPFFQCFFVRQNSSQLIELSLPDIDFFVLQRRTYFHHLYVHGSYWINLAGISYTGHRALYRELYLARKLEFTHFIVHPGSAKGALKREEGIGAVARALNRIVQRESELCMVLENTAHGNMTVGGDIHDLAAIIQRLDHPERVGVCLDTAHAHSFGYDMVTEQGRAQFIELVADIIGLEKVVLLHINDACDPVGSKLDRHQLPGQGVIGLPALRAFATHQQLQHVPLLVEPPLLTDEQEHALLQLVRSWE